MGKARSDRASHQAARNLRAESVAVVSETVAPSTIWAKSVVAERRRARPSEIDDAHGLWAEPVAAVSGHGSSTHGAGRTLRTVKWAEPVVTARVIKHPAFKIGHAHDLWAEPVVAVSGHGSSTHDAGRTLRTVKWAEPVVTLRVVEQTALNIDTAHNPWAESVVALNHAALSSASIPRSTALTACGQSPWRS
jgi:hypothetical protein